MNGSERAAVLMMSMGEELAAGVLRYLEPDEIERIGSAMADIGAVTQQQVGGIVNRFYQEVGDVTALSVGSGDYVEGLLTKALGGNKARTILGRILGAKGASGGGLDMLRWLGADAIAAAVAAEHPQVIATILAHLPEEKAGEVLSHLPEGLPADVLVRLATLDSVPAQALQELDTILSKALAEETAGATTTIGGVKAAADLVNTLRGTAGSDLLESVREIDAALADNIEEMMFVFENLLEIDGRGIQALLREVQSDTLLVALKGAAAEMQEHIFSNMSKRAAELLREDLEARGPMRLAEVEVAQKEILTVVRQLIERGDIAFGQSGGDYV